MAKRKRNYRREYDKYHKKPSQKKARASRNAARRKMAKAGKVCKGDGKEVDHKNGNPRDNRRKNLKVTSRRANRKKGG
tara:strand:- start:509 stop:742 length:234 start_codon:yes stop_codon:yes gene_type:complete